MKLSRSFLIFIICQLLFVQISFGQIIYQENQSGFVGKSLTYFVDTTGETPVEAIQSKNFKPVENKVPNFGLSNSIYWFKVAIKNLTEKEDLLLVIRNPSITHASLYAVQDKKISKVEYSGEAVPFSKRFLRLQNPIFQVHIPSNSTKEFFLKVESINTLLMPVEVTDSDSIITSSVLDQYIFGIYFGIVLVMIFYNFFIYLSVKDKNYLYYVFYILSVGFTQGCLKGYAQKFLWPENTSQFLNVPNYAIAFSGIFSIVFVIHFLQVKNYSRFLLTLLKGIILLYLGSAFINLLNAPVLAQEVLQLTTGLAAVVVMISGIIILRKGFKPALFFNISWSFFVISVVIYVLKDAGILPLNSFTNNSILFGSSIEIALLSFALADKINIYKKEKEESQAEALRIAQENEQLIKEQNVVLEKKVQERTIDLQNTNQKLGKTLSDLQEAQIQLVEAEKMASLGQLTAGIAHEINNPINFVKSNIKPLQLDLEDLLQVIDKYDQLHNSKDNHLSEKLEEIHELKEELDIDFLKSEIKSLIKGIEEGAERTAEIVRSLRTFSRLDEGELKDASVHDGINSTIVLLKNNIPHHVKLVKHFDANGSIECYPGKLNQVFMNIINNAVQAIAAKKQQSEKESITITTRDIEDDKIEIRIKDTGIGMSEEVKQKVFDPFFTTKDVGEGTGLGMSIVFKIIEKHGGKIKINSAPGEGAEFIIILPHKQSVVFS